MSDSHITSERNSDQNPMSQHYLGKSGEDYFAWQQGAAFRAGRLQARMFGDYVKSEDNVLDFGCGGGFFLKAIHCSTKSGVEVNPAARKTCIENGIPATGEISTVPTSSVSLVTSIHSLEHVLQPLTVLEELHRVLHHGGRLLVCTPIDHWWTFRRYERNDIHHHLFTWTAQNLGNLISEAGFEVESIKTWTFAWPPRWAHFFERIPWPVFAAVCQLWGWVSHSRQLVALARKA
jgi:2-polyprenyl-3-methyl-5-hydroxy-6-metoxy-1,4-benzoquinol methylase